MMKNNFAGIMLICLTVFLTASAPLEQKQSLAPNFTVRDLAQIPIELASFKDKRPVVLFFWTTWCPYCLKALKNFSQNLPEWEQEGITVLPINSGESLAKVTRFAQSNGYTFRIFLDSDSAVADSYNVYGVPSYFIVDKKGYLRAASNTFPHDEVLKLAQEE